ncbi:glycosyltransferase [Vibrio splendidus]
MKIAIIVINYNNKLGLLKTLTTIAGQDLSSYSSKCCDVIVIDGGSTDGSVDVIKKHGDIMNLHWTSEPDSGIYDAMNKGLNKVECSSFTHFMFLNSGDCFSSNESMSKIFDAIKLNSKYNILFFKVKNLHKNLYNYRPLSIEEKTFKNNVSREYFPCHQGVLCSVSIIKGLRFDERLNISADTKFLKDIFSYNPSKYIPEYIVDFELGGVSSYYDSISHCLKHAKEKCYNEDVLSRKTMVKIYFLGLSKYFFGKLVGKNNYFRFYFGVKKIL